MGYFSNGLAI